MTRNYNTQTIPANMSTTTASNDTHGSINPSTAIPLTSNIANEPTDLRYHRFYDEEAETEHEILSRRERNRKSLISSPMESGIHCPSFYPLVTGRQLPQCIQTSWASHTRTGLLNCFGFRKMRPSRPEYMDWRSQKSGKLLKRSLSLGVSTMSVRYRSRDRDANNAISKQITSPVPLL